MDRIVTGIFLPTLICYLNLFLEQQCIEKIHSVVSVRDQTIRKKINFIVEKTDTGFSAFSEDYPIFTTGTYFSELLHNAVEATNLHLMEENSLLQHKQIKFSSVFTRSDRN
jgi:hypothetical protein